MLVLSRHVNESILILPNVRIRLIDINCNRARIGFEAPPDVEIWREELWLRHEGKLNGRKRKRA